MADEVKTPCEEQLTKVLPQKAVMERREFKTEINVNWAYIPVVYSCKQWSCKKEMLCFLSSSPETFVVAAFKVLLELVYLLRICPLSRHGTIWGKGERLILDQLPVLKEDNRQLLTGLPRFLAFVRLSFCSLFT